MKRCAGLQTASYIARTHLSIHVNTGLCQSVVRTLAYQVSDPSTLGSIIGVTAR